MRKNKKITQSTVFILIITMLLGAFACPAVTLAAETYDFANFTEADSMAFVAAHSIDIPKILLKSEKMASFTQSIIQQSYNAPDVPFCFNYDKTQQYAEEIRLAVRSHMDLGSIASVASTSAYALQYNKVMDSNGNWVTSGGYYNNKWLNYNCYAYSINRAEQPPFYDSGRQYQPGDMSGKGIFDDCGDIDDLADLIEADLLAMGYSDILLSSTIPSVDQSQELICVRRNFADYHFMRYDIETNAWYHKPGNTAVLKYNFIPSNSNLWYVEVSYYGTEILYDDLYDSNIIFIRYTKNQINVPQTSTSRKYIKPNKDVFCEMNFSQAGCYKVQLTSSFSFKYEIYDENFDVVSHDDSCTNITFYLSTNSEKYYLRMNFNTNTALHYVDINITQHTHNYGSYVYNSHSSHIRRCLCGATESEGHYIRYSDIVDNRYARCLGCNKMLDLYVDIAQSELSNIAYVTINGSCILPNGIVVLKDADVEAYINGTLQFYYIDDVPAIE